MGIGTRKRIGDIAAEEHHLHRSLGAWQLIAMGVAGTIGAGIFVLTGTVAANHAGPAVAISFALAGLACLGAALAYAEFSSMITVSGSAYTYAYATLGELVAWIIGWALVLEYLFAAATVSVGWSGYLGALLSDFGVHLPPALANAPLRGDGHGVAATGALVNLPAATIALMLTAVLYVGIRQSALATNVMVAMKVGALLLILGFGIWYIQVDNLTPFIPANTGTWGEFGWSGIVRGAGIVFFAYVGFDAVSTCALEARNPNRDVPRGILGTLAVCAVLYVLMCIVVVGLADYRTLNVPQPLVAALKAAGGALDWLTPLVGITAVVGLASAMLIAMYGQTRIFYIMSSDGLLPKFLSRLHPRYQTPHIGTLLVGFSVALIGGLLPIDVLGELASIGTLLAFVVVSIGVIVLRYVEPDAPRAFRMPFGIFFPVLGAISCAALMLALPLGAWLRLAGWMAIGVTIYLVYGRIHSVAAARAAS